MTSKGQFTLPAAVRKALALNATGDTLQLEFDATDRTIYLTKPVTLAELQQFVQAKTKNPAAVLPADLHKWHEQERIKDLRKRGSV